MWIVLVGCLFGLAQGARHAFEPDHLVALSTMIGEERTMRGRMLYAASWGTGHGLVLFVVGGTLFVLRRSMPPVLDRFFEAAVAAMLVALGVRALFVARRVFPRETSAGKAMARPRTSLVRPLAMGMIHGLAGSGAVTAVALAELPSAEAAFAFVLLFGLGATLSMAIVAGLAGAPLGYLLRHPVGTRTLFGCAGTLSLVLGALIAVDLLSRAAG